jgi:hypothetical protein
MILCLAKLPKRLTLKRVKKDIREVIENIETGLMDDFLELLLDLMGLAFYLNIRRFRDNIKNFKGTYNFVSQDGRIAAAAVFANNKMKMKKEKVPDNDPDLKVTVTFKDGHALWRFLLTGTPDIFQFVLDRDISYEGNLNYLLKFAYLARHMKTIFSL